jgi:hypothetical protein
MNLVMEFLSGSAQKDLDLNILAPLYKFIFQQAVFDHLSVYASS